MCHLLHFFFAHIHLCADIVCRFTGLSRTVCVLIYLVGDFINSGSEFLHRAGLLGCPLGKLLGAIRHLGRSARDLSGTLADLQHCVIELICNAPEQDKQRIKAACIRFLTGRINRKISFGHFRKELILILNNKPKLMDQSAYLSGEDTQFILRGIGDLYIQIPFRHFYGGILDFRDRGFDQAYDHKWEEDAYEDDGNDNCHHGQDGGSVKGSAFRRCIITPLCIVVDDIIKSAVQRVEKRLTFSVQNRTGTLGAALFGESHHFFFRLLILCPEIVCVVIEISFFLIDHIPICGQKGIHGRVSILEVLKAGRLFAIRACGKVLQLIQPDIGDGSAQLPCYIYTGKPARCYVARHVVHPAHEKKWHPADNEHPEQRNSYENIKLQSDF